MSGGYNTYRAINNTVERHFLNRNSWKFLPDMEKERISHGSTVLHNSFLYIVDQAEISVLNIESPSKTWNSIKISPSWVPSQQKFAEKWKNGIVVFEKGSKHYSIYKEEGGLQGTRKLERGKTVDCYHGLCTLSIKGSLVVCDDRNQIFNIPFAWQVEILNIWLNILILWILIHQPSSSPFRQYFSHHNPLLHSNHSHRI